MGRLLVWYLFMWRPSIWCPFMCCPLIWCPFMVRLLIVPLHGVPLNLVPRHGVCPRLIIIFDLRLFALNIDFLFKIYCEFSSVLYMLRYCLYITGHQIGDNHLLLIVFKWIILAHSFCDPLYSSDLTRQNSTRPNLMLHNADPNRTWPTFDTKRYDLKSPKSVEIRIITPDNFNKNIRRYRVLSCFQQLIRPDQSSTVKHSTSKRTHVTQELRTKETSQSYIMHYKPRVE